MSPQARARRDWRHVLSAALDAALLLVIVAAMAARIVELPHYVPDSGDEWGNTIAPFRVLFERGNPGTFFHPSLYYDVTAAVYAVVFATVKLLGLVDGTMLMTDLLVMDQRYFVYAARAVSTVAAALAMWASYGLGRRMWGRRGGLFAAALLAACPTHAIYSEAVRVDSLFLPLFIYAFAQIVRLLDDPRPAQYARAGLLAGLATGANYNGVILMPWLAFAHVLQCRQERRHRSGGRALALAALLAAAGLVMSSPFLLLDLPRAVKYIAFLAGISLADHPGVEGRGALFYAEELARANPIVSTAIAVASIVIAVAGTRSERFLLSLPAAYVVAFSLMRTKFDRFILPGLALLLVVAAGLPALLARRWRTPRVVAALGPDIASTLLLASIAIWLPRAIPVPRNQMLARSDEMLFEWIEQYVPPRSHILVEPGMLPLVDAVSAPGAFADALRGSMVRMRPNLDQEFVAATYLGAQSNYDFAAVAEYTDYAVVSPRNVEYIRSRCDVFADVCAFYYALGQEGRLMYQAPDGYELALIYRLRPE